MTGDARYEIQDDQFIQRAPANAVRNQVIATISAHCWLASTHRPAARIHAGDLAVVIDQAPAAWTLIPDIALFAPTFLLDGQEHHHSETAPSVVIDIHDESRPMMDLRRRARLYLRAGVQTVILLDPFRGLVEQFDRHAPAQSCSAADAIDLDSWIPGVSIPTAALRLTPDVWGIVRNPAPSHQDEPVAI